MAGGLKLFAKNDQKLAMIGVGALMWTVWKCRNAVIFDGKNVMISMTYWITSWSILQTKDQARRMLELGSRLLEQVASEVYRASQGWRINVARIQA